MKRLSQRNVGDNLFRLCHLLMERFSRLKRSKSCVRASLILEEIRHTATAPSLISKIIEYISDNYGERYIACALWQERLRRRECNKAFPLVHRAIIVVNDSVFLDDPLLMRINAFPFIFRPH